MRTAVGSSVFWLCLMVYFFSLAEAVAFTRFGLYLIVNLVLTALFIAGLTGTIRSIAHSSGHSTFYLLWRGWILIWLLPAMILNPLILVALDRVFKRFGYNLQLWPFLLYLGLTLLAGAYVVWFVRGGNCCWPGSPLAAASYLSSRYSNPGHSSAVGGNGLLPSAPW